MKDRVKRGVRFTKYHFFQKQVPFSIDTRNTFLGFWKTTYWSPARQNGFSRELWIWRVTCRQTAISYRAWASVERCYFARIQWVSKIFIFSSEKFWFCRCFFVEIRRHVKARSQEKKVKYRFVEEEILWNFLGDVEMVVTENFVL